MKKMIPNENRTRLILIKSIVKFCLFYSIFLYINVTMFV